MEKQKTLLEKAKTANDRSMACKKCNFVKKPAMLICQKCGEAFIEGYQKGYAQALKELKQKQN